MLHGATKLRKVINAWGPATAVGVSRSPPQVRIAVAEALGNYYVIEELERACSERISAWAGSQAACVTHCTAAALTLAVAACMTGTDAKRIAQLPDANGMRRSALLLKSHDVDYGARLTQAVRLAGADPILCDDIEQLGKRLTEGGVACVIVVESLLAPGSGSAQTKAIVARCAGRAPIVFDAAAQDRRIAELSEVGADLVLISGQKYLGAPTSGIVVGGHQLIAAVRAQHRGIGRGMKPTKEAMVGLLAALEARTSQPSDALDVLLQQKLDAFQACAETWPGIETSLEDDSIDGQRRLLWLRVDEEVCGLSATDLRSRLYDSDVAIVTAPYRLALGCIGLDLHGVSTNEIDPLCQLVAHELKLARSGGPPP